MRAIFGLVGLLVVIGVIVVFWSVFHPADIVRMSESPKQQAEQIAGVDRSGNRAKDSISLDPVLKDGKLRYVLVEKIVAGGAMERYYGLKRGDAIIEASHLDLKDQDGEMAIELIHKGYQSKATIVVIRDGKHIQLPQEPGTEATPAKTDSNSPIHQQLDAIPGIR